MGENLKKLLIGNQKGRPLPGNRKTQLKYIIKDNYGMMIVLSILSFLFLLPSIVISIIMSFNQAQALKDSGEALIGTIIMSTNFSLLLYLIPTVPLVSIALAGLFNYIKRLVWDEKVSFKDYFLGIKTNGLKFILLGYFAYLFIFMFVMAISYYGFNSSWPEIIRYCIISLTGIVCFIVSIYVLYMMSIVTRYKTTIKQLFSNGFKLTFYRLFKNIGVSLVFILPWVVNLFIPSYWQFIIYLLEMVFLIALSILIIEEYHAYNFDECVNKSSYPEIYRKGLISEEELKEQINKEKYKE